MRWWEFEQITRLSRKLIFKTFIVSRFHSLFADRSRLSSSPSESVTRVIFHSQKLFIVELLRLERESERFTIESWSHLLSSKNENFIRITPRFV